MEEQYLIKLEEAAKLADSNNPFERYNGDMALISLLDCGSVLELVELARKALAIQGTTGVELIAAERKRQLEEEGWSIERDVQEHISGALATAAMCYAAPSDTGPLRFFRGKECPAMWPWSPEWWKPSPYNRIRELVKAGALIAAEIDRQKVIERKYKNDSN